MISTKKVNLTKPYLTKKIAPSSLKTVLASTHQTAYRLYLITNGIEELQHFVEAKHDKFWISGTVKTIAAPASNVKKQVWSIIHLKPILDKKPRYELKCSVTLKATNKDVYRCKLTSINPEMIYKQIQECIHEIKEIINEKNY